MADVPPVSRSIIAPARSLNVLPHGVVAGIVGGITVDAFLLAAGAGKFPTVYQYIASALVGKAAYASGSYVWLGLVMHFLISIAWGVAYAALCQRLGTRVLDRPIVAGSIFGIVVWIVMQAALVPVHLWQPPTSALALLVSLLAHTLFFGIPIAWYVRSAVRRRMPA